MPTIPKVKFIIEGDGAGSYDSPSDSASSNEYIPFSRVIYAKCSIPEFSYHSQIVQRLAIVTQ